MKCPTCPDQTLTLSERQGVEIDYCPACRGVWLDRGELDKLLERSQARDPRHPTAVDVRARHPDFVDSDHAPGQRRRKSWLSDIFD